MLECLVGNPMKLLNIVSAIRLRTGKFLLVDQSSLHVWHLLAEATINGNYCWFHIVNSLSVLPTNKRVIGNTGKHTLKFVEAFITNGVSLRALVDLFRRQWNFEADRTRKFQMVFTR